MRKLLSAFFAVLLTSVLLPSCSGDSDSITYTLTISPKDMELVPGETMRIKPSVSPDASNVVYSYKSKDTDVATVKDNGTVTAVSTGDARIVVTATIGDQTLTGNCYVTVTKVRLQLSESEIGLFVGDEQTLTAQLSTDDNAKVTWASDNTAVATVTGGTIKAVSTGEATITASCKYEDETYTATCKVSVVGDLAIVPVSVNLMVGQPYQLKTNVAGDASWSSNDASVASVDNSGTVTAHAVGSATITATMGSHTATATVTVTTFSLVEKTTGVGIGKTTQLHTNAPEGTTITWSSSDAAVATVSAAGLVTGVTIGTATVTASCYGQTATCLVTVTEKDPVRLDEHVCDLYEGYSVTLTANVPSNQITWSLIAGTTPLTMNNGVVTYSTNNNGRGYYDYKYAYAVAEYGGTTDTCKVRCFPRPQWDNESTGVTIDISNHTWYDYSLFPYSLTDFDYSFSNSDAVYYRERNVGYKGYDGETLVGIEIRAKAVGTVYLTATYKGSNPYLKGKSATLKFTLTDILGTGASNASE